jgi:hypothetical protein
MLIINYIIVLYFRLGATFDGTADAISCPASMNNIMTPTIGRYTNASGYLYYSNCSINAIKSTLLTPDRRFPFIHKYLILIL